MTEKIRMLISGIDSCHDFQKRLLEKIDEKIHFDSCIIIMKNADNTDHICDERVKIYDYNILNKNQYCHFYNINELIPLDKTILKAMEPYFETSLHSLLRNYDHDLYTFDEAKDKYLDHLRFWNHQFASGEINFVLITSVPHQCHNYIIYALAKIYGVKIRFFLKNSIANRNLPLDNLDGELTKVSETYHQLCEEATNIELAPDVEEYYQIMKKRDVLNEVSMINGGTTKKGLSNRAKEQYYRFFTLSGRWNNNKSHIKHLITDRFVKHDKSLAEWHRSELQYYHILYKRFKNKQKQFRGIKYYESLATSEVQDEKYLVYYLHYTPEATTMPQAGVFADQELVITLLDYYLAKLGIKLYVKEHYIQVKRPKWFYDKLSALSNTRLISSGIDSVKLSSTAIASATCDGSIIQESIINSRPVLAFGTGAFSYAPGVYRCANGEDIIRSVKEILNGVTIDQNNVRRYFKAFEMNTVLAKTEVSASLTGMPTISEEESLKNLADYIIQEVQSGC